MGEQGLWLVLRAASRSRKVEPLCVHRYEASGNTIFEHPDEGAAPTSCECRRRTRLRLSVRASPSPSGTGITVSGIAACENTGDSIVIGTCLGPRDLPAGVSLVLRFPTGRDRCIVAILHFASVGAR